MNLCWKLGAATARQVHDLSLKEREREYRTVKTLLDRIAAKGYLSTERVDGRLVFTPIVGRAEALRSALADFFDSVLDQSIAPLYLHLVERGDLSEEELEFFQRQLEVQGTDSEEES